MPSGYGVLDAVLNRRNYGELGGKGSGVSAFVSGAGVTHTKAGFAVAGCDGYGVSASVAVETGFGVVDADGYGTSTYVPFVPTPGPTRRRQKRAERFLTLR
jgi:hypothetical protein